MFLKILQNSQENTYATVSWLNETEAGTKIRDAVVRYIAFHQSTFREYEGEIMPEPTPEVLHFFEQLNLTKHRLFKFTEAHTCLSIAHSVVKFCASDVV